MHVCSFDLEHVKVIWGHSVHFSENWVATQKRLIVSETDENLGLGGVCIMHVDILTLTMSNSFGVIWCTFSNIGP